MSLAPGIGRLGSSKDQKCDLWGFGGSKYKVFFVNTTSPRSLQSGSKSLSLQWLSSLCTFLSVLTLIRSAQFFAHDYAQLTSYIDMRKTRMRSLSSVAVKERRQGIVG